MPDIFPPKGFIQIASEIDGIEVFQPAPQEASKPAVEVFKCPQCGATTAYDLSTDGLSCPHCGYVSKPQSEVVGTTAIEHEFREDIVRSSSLGWGVERKDLVCQQCGAVLSIPVETLASTCSFCGSNRVINRVAAQDQIRPLFLVPYKVKPESCQAIAREWLGNSWMVPSELKTAASLDSFVPIFIPFWTFDSTCHASWKAEVGREETEFYVENGERKSRVVIRWRWQSGSVSKHFEDVQIPATGYLSQKILQKVGEYNLHDLVPYQSIFLAGIQAQSYDIKLEDSWESAREKMRNGTRTACVAQAGSPHIRNFSMDLDFSNESWRLILVPIYATVYRFNDSRFQILINGQTGVISGPRPADWNKIWLVIAAMLSPGILLGIFGLVTAILGIGLAIGILGFILLIIGMIVGAIIFKQAQELDDV
jgi:DNA-directed RNA polymerase subunit RPC12/RpoP